MTITVTLAWRCRSTPSLHRHAENPIGVGKSAADDDNDAHDDELQRFSEEGAALSS
jgi:hypothetical protein